MALNSTYIWIDDRLKDSQEATLPFINAGLHYGISVFEGIRCYETDRGAAIFRLEEHVDRLLNSAHILGLRELPFNRQALIAAIRQTVAANGFAACYIRPLIFVDGAMNLVIDAGKPRLVIAVWEWKTFFSQEAKERGIRANISSLTRLHPNVSMTKAKISGNYVGSVMAKTESVRMGFDEAIMLDPAGYVAECTGENLFVVRGGVIYTVPRCSILEGITRDSIITLAQDLGYRVVEEAISRDQLYMSDEVFVTGTAAEVVAIREIDFRKIASGKAGPVTTTLQHEFEKLTRGEHGRSEQWLSYVPAMSASVKV
ncbi:MAG: branched-chain amino acid transaminase [Acidobacteria bacterium]|nr:branched-chain amino acid transaminase [Acidobacteriota bacterium]